MEQYLEEIINPHVSDLQNILCKIAEVTSSKGKFTLHLVGGDVIFSFDGYEQQPN